MPDGHAIKNVIKVVAALFCSACSLMIWLGYLPPLTIEMTASVALAALALGILQNN